MNHTTWLYATPHTAVMMTAKGQTTTMPFDNVDATDTADIPDTLRATMVPESE